MPPTLRGRTRPRGRTSAILQRVAQGLSDNPFSTSTNPFMNPNGVPNQTGIAPPDNSVNTGLDDSSMAPLPPTTTRPAQTPPVASGGQDPSVDPTMRNPQTGVVTNAAFHPGHEGHVPDMQAGAYQGWYDKKFNHAGNPTPQGLSQHYTDAYTKAYAADPGYHPWKNLMAHPHDTIMHALSSASAKVPVRCVACGQRGELLLGSLTATSTHSCGGDLELDDTDHEASRHTAAGPGYYVVRNGRALSGPYPSPSEAYAQLDQNRGDGVEYLRTGDDVEGQGEAESFPTPMGYDLPSDDRGRFPGGSSIPYSSPSFWAKRAKIREITASVLATNPGMPKAQAREIAKETVARYPSVAGKPKATV